MITIYKIKPTLAVPILVLPVQWNDPTKRADQHLKKLSRFNNFYLDKSRQKIFSPKLFS